MLRVCTRLQVCRLLRGRGLLKSAAVCQRRILGMGLSAPIDSVIFICSSHTAPPSAVNSQTLRTMSCHICGMKYQLSETEYLSFPVLINPCQTSSLVVPHHEAFIRRDHAHLRGERLPTPHHQACEGLCRKLALQARSDVQSFGLGWVRWAAFADSQCRGRSQAIALTIDLLSIQSGQKQNKERCSGFSAIFWAVRHIHVV